MTHAGKRTGPDQQDRFYRNRSSLPDFVIGTGSYRNRFYQKFPMVPSGPLVTGLDRTGIGSYQIIYVPLYY
ncbi:hypothetical protein H5410_063160 [Solanum commersonii]|uniref:Uncharacterized protein n=1 Tax=Solanum commersonii TaxID=4109 RepID=A0A9J5WCT1_SOLCO|nr:hypothetical protein H5410_063160 [Solanum commersonii]